jgi:hypothetical protein
MEGVLQPVAGKPAAAEPAIRKVDDGDVQVSVRQDSPLKATLRTTRKRGRDMIYAA